MSYNEELIIKPSKLLGEITISGAKNSALRLLVASILTKEKVILNNYPGALLDAEVQVEMLQFLGKECCVSGTKIEILEPNKLIQNLSYAGRSIRNTLLILGALVTRFGHASVPLPGGCDLGDRKFDLHCMLLERLGSKVWQEGGMLYAEAIEGRLVGEEIHLPIRSTGATENAILSGTLAKGRTRIWNPHIRPEVIDLICMLRKMGAKIIVRGQESIIIDGVDQLTTASHTVMPDNIEALTWLIGSVVTNGAVTIRKFPFEHLEIPLIHLRESGIRVEQDGDTAIVRDSKVYPVEISTGPYPGINSDMQPLFAVLAAIARGKSHIIDLRFPGRYGYTEELNKLGVQFCVEGNLLQIEGGNALVGSKVKALDLRAGAALMLAGFVSKGETVISDAWQIRRGYCDLEKKLSQLGVSHSFVK